jgi:hypothetical protein
MTNDSDDSDEDAGVMGVVIDQDGKWFVVEHVPEASTSRPIAGPYRTEAAVRRWTETYPSPVGAITIMVSVPWRVGGCDHPR